MRIYEFLVKDKQGSWGSCKQAAPGEADAREAITNWLRQTQLEPNGSLEEPFELELIQVMGTDGKPVRMPVGFFASSKKDGVIVAVHAEVEETQLEKISNDVGKGESRNSTKLQLLLLRALTEWLFTTASGYSWWKYSNKTFNLMHVAELYEDVGVNDPGEITAFEDGLAKHGIHKFKVVSFSDSFDGDQIEDPHKTLIDAKLANEFKDDLSRFQTREASDALSELIAKLEDTTMDPKTKSFLLHRGETALEILKERPDGDWSGGVWARKQKDKGESTRWDEKEPMGMTPASAEAHPAVMAKPPIDPYTVGMPAEGDLRVDAITETDALTMARAVFKSAKIANAQEARAVLAQIEKEFELTPENKAKLVNTLSERWPELKES